MFLKRITLHGFKSFADRTEFEFASGITGIVGPNGCGKSNILDAVRWVLGEQSARSLRGGKMADVIFAGSRSRKPAHHADVELTFDNRTGVLRSDQDEVVVGRVLYANGDSEYRLNGNPCRLKDIRELLLDTGVGVDAYSVIEQGRVDLLLQASPVERREIFEEAAGISRYKVRRIEAQRKLERTQHNLLRLQDIVEELERRLRSVRLAAGKARSFQEYDCRLRELRSSFSLAEYHELEQRRQALREQIERLSEALQTERTRIAEQDAAAAEMTHALQALDDQIQAADAEVLALQTALSALAERIAQVERRCQDLAAARERRARQVSEVEARVQAVEQRRAAEADALVQLRAAEAEGTAQIAELAAARDAARQRTEEARQALEREKIAAYEAVRQAALLQNEHENATQQHDRLVAQAQRFTARRDEVSGQQRDVDERLRTLQTRLDAADRQSTELSGALRSLDTRLEELHARAAALDTQIGATKEDRSATSSRLALLEDMERRLEGVDAGTRTALGWRTDEGAGATIVGLVAELLRIDDPRVALLQPVLSDFENRVVVQDTEALLTLLAERGTPEDPLRVLALDRVPQRPLPGGYEHTPGFVARAADWVQCDPAHRPLAEHLLGRTIIVDTRARALRLASAALLGYTFVSLDGWSVAADGRITGGSMGTAAGLISRKAEIRQLRGELDEIETRLERLQREQAVLVETMADGELQRQSLLEQIATVQREHAELRTARAGVTEESQRIARELRGIADELAGVERTLGELGARLAELTDRRTAAGQAQESHEARIESLVRELESLEQELSRLAQAHTEARVEKERVSEKRAATEDSLAELGHRLAALEDERSGAAREAAEAAAEIDTAAREIDAARQQHAVDQAACGQRQAGVVALRERRQQLRQQIEESGALGRAHQRRVEALEHEQQEQRVTLREVEVRAEDLVARVRDELELDLPRQYAEYRPADQDWDAIRTEIEELRGRISRLGNVNLDAIHELEELTPRYEHLVEQRTDLQDAIERLEKLIVELDNESRTRFAATFEEVRGNFQEMFRKLFGGGKADIILEDPENPLECGIEIIARPPGKEPQSISLLSGGEKTMTAVALLMGVFKCRPSPFAILDEVDAALDESNVDRFNTLLHEFLSQSQFVVITHSKRTMACVDALYGITMEEPGVSKRVSVRFDDRVDTPHVA